MIYWLIESSVGHHQWPSHKGCPEINNIGVVFKCHSKLWKKSRSTCIAIWRNSLFQAGILTYQPILVRVLVRKSQKWTKPDIRIWFWLWLSVKKQNQKCRHFNSQFKSVARPRKLSWSDTGCWSSDKMLY